MPAATKGSLAEALLAVQKSAPKVQKDQVNPAFRGSKYASTDSILDAILPLLNENGLVLTQFPCSLPAAEYPVPALRTRITHVASEEYIEDVMPLMLDKQNAQGLGGAITYGRRYAVTSMLGLVADTDDDGNAASAREVAVVNRPRTRTAAKAAPASAPADGDEGW